MDGWVGGQMDDLMDREVIKVGGSSKAFFIELGIPFCNPFIDYFYNKTQCILAILSSCFGQTKNIHKIWQACMMYTRYEFVCHNRLIYSRDGVHCVFAREYIVA